MPDLLVTIGADATQYNKTMGSLGDSASSAVAEITANIQRLEAELELLKSQSTSAFAINSPGNYNNQLKVLESSLVTLRHQQEDLLTPIQDLGKTGTSALNNVGNSAMSASMRFQTMRSGISAARDGVLAFSTGGQAAERSLLAMGHHITSLVNETGSFKGAISALGSSLWGAGGIILALSLAAELYGKWRDSQKQAKETTDEFKKSLDSAVESSSTELAHLTALYGASQNDALSRKARLEAVKDLQKEYPSYFGNLSKEAILAGQAQSAYEGLTGAIINQAIVTAGQENLKAAIKPLIEIVTQLNEQQSKLDESFKKAPKNIKSNSGQSSQGFSAVNNFQTSHPIIGNSFVQNADGDLQTYDEYQKKIKDKIKSAGNALQDLISQYGLSGILKKEDKEKPTKALDAYEQAQKNLQVAQEAVNVALTNGTLKADDFGNSLNRNLNAAQAVLDNIKTGVATLNTGFTHTNLSANSIQDGKRGVLRDTTLQGQVDAFNKNSKAIYDSIKANNEYSNAVKSADAIDKRRNKTLNELTNVIGQGLTSAFESALSGTQSFVQAMGQFLTQLIERLLAAAAAALVLSLIVSAFTGGAALGSFGKAFGSLSGLGGLIGGGAGTGDSITHMASGGIATGPTRALIGEGGEPEAVMPLSKLQNFVNTSGGGSSDRHIVGVLKGADFQLWSVRSAKQKRRLS